MKKRICTLFPKKMQTSELAGKYISVKLGSIQKEPSEREETVVVTGV